jgi:hypothetical protein
MLLGALELLRRSQRTPSWALMCSIIRWCAGSTGGRPLTPAWIMSS